MTEIGLINKKIAEAEKRIRELIQRDDLKKFTEQEKYKISEFYETKGLNRLETARLIFNSSGDASEYQDYGEAVSAAYYAMYYIVHAFLALKYKRKLREDVRGVHAITRHVILYYLVKTKKLAKHLYQEYVRTLNTTAHIQRFNIDEYQKQAYSYVRKYQDQREKREIFTYYVSPDAEKYQADKAIKAAEEFISTIRQLMNSPG